MHPARPFIAGSSLPYILFALAALPVEPHVAGVFIRPLYLAGLLAYLLFIASPPWRIARAQLPYYQTSLILVGYLLAKGDLNRNMSASLKEVAEVFIAMGVFWFGCLTIHVAGFRQFMRTAGRCFFLFALGYMMSQYAAGDFLSFKDAYWVILFSCVTATIEVRHCKTREATFRMILSILILILSGSRTGWVAYFLFSIIEYGIGARQIIMVALFGSLLALISIYNPQTVAYAATVTTLWNAVTSISFTDLHGWLTIADNFQNPSDTHRLTEIIRALLIIESHPLIGVGVDQYINYATNKIADVQTMDVIGAHNELLRILAEGGILHLCIIVTFYMVALKNASNARDRLIGRTCMALLAASVGMFLLTATNFMITFLLQLSLMLSTFPASPHNDPGKSNA